MTSLARWMDGKVSLIAIIFLFWTVFWVLNGGDKFFNGEYVANLDDWSAKGVLVDSDGRTTHTLHPMETVGPFGVNRDAQMIGFFQRIYLPDVVALGSLYGIAVAELSLGLAFLVLLVWSFLPEDRKQKPGLLADRTFHRMAFKGSMLIFVLFAIGDNLFGERTELWEHGTFLVLCLITYELWQRADRYLPKRRGFVGHSRTRRGPQRAQTGIRRENPSREEYDIDLQALCQAETVNAHR